MTLHGHKSHNSKRLLKFLSEDGTKNYTHALLKEPKTKSSFQGNTLQFFIKFLSPIFFTSYELE